MPAVDGPTTVVPVTLDPAVLDPAVLVPAVLVPAVLVPAALVPAALVPAALDPAALVPAVLDPAALDPAVRGAVDVGEPVTDRGPLLPGEGDAAVLVVHAANSAAAAKSAPARRKCIVSSIILSVGHSIAQSNGVQSCFAGPVGHCAAHLSGPAADDTWVQHKTMHQRKSAERRRVDPLA